MTTKESSMRRFLVAGLGSMALALFPGCTVGEDGLDEEGELGDLGEVRDLDNLDDVEDLGDEPPGPVAAPVLYSFSASPTTVPRGGRVNFSWSSNANVCYSSAYGPGVPGSGSGSLTANVSPGTYSVSMRCINGQFQLSNTRYVSIRVF
jgi:hypothetical protein